MGADVVCVPAYVTPRDTWTTLWGGYSGRQRHFPRDFQPGDIGRLLVSLFTHKLTIELLMIIDVPCRSQRPGPSTHSRAGSQALARRSVQCLVSPGRRLHTQSRDLVRRAGMCSYMVGTLWELTGGGESTIVSSEGQLLAKAPEGVEDILVHQVQL